MNGKHIAKRLLLISFGTVFLASLFFLFSEASLTPSLNTGSGNNNKYLALLGASAIGDEIDSGVRIFDGTRTVAIAGKYRQCDADAPLCISKGGQAVGLVLVSPSDLRATNIFIQTTGGKKALKEYIANSSPVLASIGNKSVTVGNLLTFTISATDLDGDILNYSANNMPTGAIFTAFNKTFTWTPNIANVGSHSVTFIVSDSKGGSDSKTITITVTPPSPPQGCYQPCSTVADCQPGLNCVSVLNSILKKCYTSACGPSPSGIR